MVRSDLQTLKWPVYTPVVVVVVGVGVVVVAAVVRSSSRSGSRRIRSVSSKEFFLGTMEYPFHGPRLGNIHSN